ncbi:MAG: NACHT domain-containing protein [Cyanobacteria bacterium J06592_8]
MQGENNQFIQGDNNSIILVQVQDGQTIEKRDKTQQKFLHWVETEVEKRLQQSLHNRVYIVLDKQEDTEQIQHPWEIDIKVGEQPSSRLPENTPIEQVFDRRYIAGRLLILGAPGSGKTTMLLKLAEQLVIRAKANPQHRIPVLLNLSSWKENNQSIKDWMIADLKVKYGVRKDIAIQWIEQGIILPLLDGLDELAAERQEKCVEKLNQFLHPETWSGSVVICSRIEEYQHYTRNLELNGSIILQSLTTEQIQDYVLKIEGEQLWNNINRDSDLMELAQTPLLLNIIVLSCTEISFERWNQFQSSKERQAYLFDAYIRRMLKRKYKTGNKPYKDKDTSYWLGWLARQLTRESQTEFLLETMQFYWVDSFLERIVCMMLYGLIMGGIYGLIFSILFKNYFLIYFGPIALVLAGFFGGLIEIFIPIKRHYLFEDSRTLVGLFLAYYAIYLQEFLEGWIDLAQWGIIYGMLLSICLRLNGFYIRILEIPKFSFTNLKVSFLFGLLIAIVISMITGLQSQQLVSGIDEGVIIGLIGGIFIGFKSSEYSAKTIPNQGVLTTSINILFLTVFYLLICIVLQMVELFLVNLDSSNSTTLLARVELSLFFGIVLIGKSIIQHFSLRLVLWFNHYIPWNYAKFLDYATDRLFLQRVGGGYRFIHDLLRQHFAEKYNEKTLTK